MLYIFDIYIYTRFVFLMCFYTYIPFLYVLYIYLRYNIHICVIFTYIYIFI